RRTYGLGDRRIIEKDRVGERPLELRHAGFRCERDHGHAAQLDDEASSCSSLRLRARSTSPARTANGGTLLSHSISVGTRQPRARARRQSAQTSSATSRPWSSISRREPLLSRSSAKPARWISPTRAIGNASI